MYKLKNTGSPYDEFVLKTGAYRLGSASDNEIVLEDSSVSAHHCEIVVTANTISLRDLSASHETYVDDERVESTQLRPGQTLRNAVSTTRVSDGDHVRGNALPDCASSP